MARTLIKAAYELAGTEYVYQVQDIMNPCIVNATIELTKLKVGDDILLRDGSVTMTGSLNLGGNKITNMADGTTSGDAVTYDQLQAAAGGLDVKEACHVATTEALPAHTGSGTGTLTATVDGALVTDGHTHSVGDRILVKNQAGEAAHIDNGIYVFTDAGDPYNPWQITRSSDADQDAEVTHGLFTFITHGDTQTGTGWSISTDDPITVNTTPIQFTQFHSPGIVIAGEGLRKEGNTVHVNFSDGTQYCPSCDGIAADPADFGNGKGLETITDSGGDGWDDIHVDIRTASGLAFDAADNDSLYVKVTDFAGDGLEATGSAPFYTLQAKLLANGGLKFAGTGTDEIAVEPNDFAGGGLIDNGSDVLEIDFAANGGITFTVGGATPGSNADTIEVKTSDFDGDGLTTVDDSHAIDALKVHITDEAGGTGGLSFTGTSPNKTLNIRLDSYGDQVLSLGHTSANGLAIAMPDGYILVGNGAATSLAKAVVMSGDATIDNTGAITVSDGVAKKDDYIVNEYIAPTHNSSGPYYIGGGASPGFTVDASTVMVFLNGVLQQPGAGNDYQLSAGGGANNQIDFTFNLKAPQPAGNPANDKILVSYFKESTP